MCLVFYIKDHHLYPIQDDRLKQIATKANQGGADNLWKYMTDMKRSNKSSNYIMYEELENNELTDEGKPTLMTIENHVIVLPPDSKIEPVIETYMIRTNYFVEYLHYDNNGRLDGCMDHKNNMSFLTTNKKTVNRSVSDYTKYTNLMTSYGAINHTPHWQPHYLNT